MAWPLVLGEAPWIKLYRDREPLTHQVLLDRESLSHQVPSVCLALFFSPHIQTAAAPTVLD